jgi:hypothetical protein
MEIMRAASGDDLGAFAGRLEFFEAFLGVVWCMQRSEACCCKIDLMISPAEMADFMFDVLCVVAACSASRCSRLQRVQRRAVRALHELLYVCTCCTRKASHVVSNVL